MGATPLAGAGTDQHRRSGRGGLAVAGGRGLLAGALRRLLGRPTRRPTGRGPACRVPLACGSAGCGGRAPGVVEIEDGHGAGRRCGRGATFAIAPRRAQPTRPGATPRLVGACSPRLARGFAGERRSRLIDLVAPRPAAIDPPASPDAAAARSRSGPSSGDHRCQACGYGVTVYRELPRCPMCGATAWAQTPRRLPRRD